MDPRHRLGRRAEDAAAAWLTRIGWRVLARRYRSTGGGEVDIVAVDPGGVLVGVEVRARSSARAGSAAESVNLRRARRVALSLAAFATAVSPEHRGLRVDMITAEPSLQGPSRSVRLRRIEGISG